MISCSAAADACIVGFPAPPLPSSFPINGTGYFYAFHLFLIMVDNDLLGRVILSVTSK